MKRFTGLLNKRSNSSDNTPVDGEPPEVSVARGVRLFCESGGPNNSGEEVLHLPVIVEGAESSPAAAKEAAAVIRKFINKDNYPRAYVQYNAIMLMRILADNPGRTFTRNLDNKFVITTKELLRDGRDASVQQILRETLDTFQIEKSQEENLQPLITMWQNEKAKLVKRGGPQALTPHAMNAPPFHPTQHQNPNYFARPHKPRGLPPPHELASRIEEAKTSAKLLLQVVQSTPPNELLANDLIKEFGDRCQSASRSIQGYIASDNPPPDEDTLLTLIETNDQLAMAMSKHQRAVLQARKVTGQGSPSSPGLPPRMPPPPQTQTQNGITPPPGPPPQQQQQQQLNGTTQATALPLSSARTPDTQPIPPPGPPPRLAKPTPQPPVENPFDDSNQAPPHPPRPNGTAVAPLQHDGEWSAPYHPGYKATPSYVRRQESAGENFTMRGAQRVDEEGEGEGEAGVRQYRF